MDLLVVFRAALQVGSCSTHWPGSQIFSSRPPPPIPIHCVGRRRHRRLRPRPDGCQDGRPSGGLTGGGTPRKEGGGSAATGSARGARWVCCGRAGKCSAHIYTHLHAPPRVQANQRKKSCSQQRVVRLWCRVLLVHRSRVNKFSDVARCVWSACIGVSSAQPHLCFLGHTRRLRDVGHAP